jgi:hypothetical protein
VKKVLCSFMAGGALCLLVSPVWAEDVPAAEAEKVKVESSEPKWQMRGQSATFFNWRQTTGEEDGSAQNDGEFYRQELSLYFSKQKKNGDKVGFDFRGRATSDEQIDSKDARLLYFRGYHHTEKWQAELGDIAGSYNPYVFSTSLKGFKFDLGQKKKTGLKTSFLAGVQKASWHDLVSNVKNEQPDRWLGGFNSTYIVDVGQSVGFTLGLARDDNSSGDSTTVNAQGAAAYNGGVDVDWRFNRYLTTKATMAYTHGTDNLRDDNDYEDGYAIKLRFLTKPLPRSLRSNFTYEYVDPDFAPLVGSGSADRERIENATSYHFNRQLKFRLTMKHSEDNLDNQKTTTTKVNDGVFYVDYRPDFLKRGDLGTRIQVKEQDSRTSDVRQIETELYFNLRPKSGWRVGGAYLYTDLHDDTTDTGGTVTGVNQHIQTLRGTLGWKKRFTNESLFRSTIHMDYRYISTAAGSQKKVGGKIDLGYDAGKYWSADLMAQTNNSNRRWADDTVYNAYQARLSYHPWADSGKVLRLTAEQRDYESDSNTTDGTYREDILELSYLFSF